VLVVDPGEDLAGAVCFEAIATSFSLSSSKERVFMGIAFVVIAFLAGARLAFFVGEKQGTGPSGSGREGGCGADNKYFHEIDFLV